MDLGRIERIKRFLYRIQFSQSYASRQTGTAVWLEEESPDIQDHSSENDRIAVEFLDPES